MIHGRHQDEPHPHMLPCGHHLPTNRWGLDTTKGVYTQGIGFVQFCMGPGKWVLRITEWCLGGSKMVVALANGFGAQWVFLT